MDKCITPIPHKNFMEYIEGVGNIVSVFLFQYPIETYLLLQTFADLREAIRSIFHSAQHGWGMLNLIIVVIVSLLRKKYSAI